MNILLYFSIFPTGALGGIISATVLRFSADTSLRLGSLLRWLVFDLEPVRIDGSILDA